jgi:hypothetical protein
VTAAVVVAALRPWKSGDRVPPSTSKALTRTCWHIDGVKDDACVYTLAAMDCVENQINGVTYHALIPSSTPTIGADVSRMTRGTCKSDPRMAP